MASRIATIALACLCVGATVACFYFLPHAATVDASSEAVAGGMIAGVVWVTTIAILLFIRVRATTVGAIRALHTQFPESLVWRFSLLPGARSELKIVSHDPRLDVNLADARLVSFAVLGADFLTLWAASGSRLTRYLFVSRGQWIVEEGLDPRIVRLRIQSKASESALIAMSPGFGRATKRSVGVESVRSKLRNW